MTKDLQRDKDPLLSTRFNNKLPPINMFLKVFNKTNINNNSNNNSKPLNMFQDTSNLDMKITTTWINLNWDKATWETAWTSEDLLLEETTSNINESYLVENII